MVDPFGRTIDYLRLSITDRCNLRCLYCMPPEGVGWIPHNEILRFEEILKICRIFASMGIKAIKVTGGEPLVRRGAVDLIKELKAINGIERVSLTSNGVLLGEYIDKIFAAGCEAVNISLDTLNEEKYRSLTGSDGLGIVLSVIDRALELDFKIKINCVPMRGFNEEDIVKLASMAKNKNITVRFIELMPLGIAAGLQPIPADGVISLIESEHGPLKISSQKLGYGPAKYYTLLGFAGFIGLISAVTHCFCKNCNRLRLTSSGILKPCLFSDLNIDLRGLVRKGACDGEILEAIMNLIIKKPAGHNFGEVAEKHDHCQKEMFRIGG